MSIFDRLDRMASATIDRTFGAAATCIPMRATPNGRPSRDPERGEILIKGAVLDEMPKAFVDIDGRTTAPVSGMSYELSVDRHRNPEVVKSRQGDKIVMDDARLFTVDSVRPDGKARIVLVLSRS